MKRTAKLLAALLATLLVLGAIPAFATPNDDNLASPGLPANTGSLTIHKFVMSDLEREGVIQAPNDGGEIGETPVSDGTNTVPGLVDPSTITSTTDIFAKPVDDVKPIQNVPFKLYWIAVPTVLNEDDPTSWVNPNPSDAPLDGVFRDLVDQFNNMAFTLANGTVTLPGSTSATTDPYVNPTKIVSAAFVTPGDTSATPALREFPIFEVMNYAGSSSVPSSNGLNLAANTEFNYDALINGTNHYYPFNQTGSTITGFKDYPIGATTPTYSNVLVSDVNGLATANGLPKGFYLAVEQRTDNVASMIAPFIVAVPMTNAAGGGWIQHVHVYPKNGDLYIEKTIDRNSVHVGELVNFSVTVSVPADIRTYQQFFITDQLDPALTYNLVPRYLFNDTTHTYPSPLVENDDNLSQPTFGSVMVYGLGGVGSPTTSDTSAPGSGVLIPPSQYESGNLRTNFEIPTGIGLPGTANKNTLFVCFFKRTATLESTLPGTSPNPDAPNNYKPPANWNESRPQELDGFWTLSQYKFIRIEFSAYVNEQILDRVGDPSRDDDVEDENLQRGKYKGKHSTTEAQHRNYTLYNQAEINFRNKFDKKATKDGGHEWDTEGDNPARRRRSNFVKLHTGAIILEKVDANLRDPNKPNKDALGNDNLNPLNGAKFKIASSKANALAGNFLKKIYLDNKGAVVDYNGDLAPSGAPTGAILTIVDVTDTPYYTDTHAKDWIEEASTTLGSYTDDPLNTAYVAGKAIARFEGLKDFGTWNADWNTTSPPVYPHPFRSGTTQEWLDLEWRASGTGGTSGKGAFGGQNQPGDISPTAWTSTSNRGYNDYWLVEVQAPAGYNLLLDPVQVIFTKENSYFDNWYTVGGNNGRLTIRNSNKFTLPKTGGIGTILFTAGGAALIGIAVFLFLLSAKKKKQKAQ